MPGADASYPVRPYPSGGTRYPLRVLLHCHDVEGLGRGTYLYDPEGHALELIGDEDIRAELMRMAPATDPSVVFPPKAGGNLHVDDCPLWVFTVADLTFQRLHYGLRSYRLVLQESGHLAQNLALVATWLGKSSVGIGGFYDDTVNAALGLDGVDSSVVYVHLVGAVEPLRRTDGRTDGRPGGRRTGRDGPSGPSCFRVTPAAGRRYYMRALVSPSCETGGRVRGARRAPEQSRRRHLS
ncbi:SagB family peptide dehydrogenase [Streptomyces zhihengii]